MPDKRKGGSEGIAPFFYSCSLEREGPPAALLRDGRR